MYSRLATLLALGMPYDVAMQEILLRLNRSRLPLNKQSSRRIIISSMIPAIIAPIISEMEA